MDSPLFSLAKKLARDQAFVLALNRVVERVVAGQCICTEPEMSEEASALRRSFKCPIHEKGKPS